MKDILIAGDTLDFVTRVPEFPASGGWTLRFRLIPHVAGPTPIELTASTYGEDYRVQLAAAATATWTPGDYSLRRWVEKAGARHVVEENAELPWQVTIQANPAFATEYDGRSLARRSLEAIEAFLAGSTAQEVQEYEINGRRLVNFKPAELILKADYFRRQVANEDRAASLAAGLGNPRHLYVRFGRA